MFKCQVRASFRGHLGHVVSSRGYNTLLHFAFAVHRQRCTQEVSWLYHLLSILPKVSSHMRTFSLVIQTPPGSDCSEAGCSWPSFWCRRDHCPHCECLQSTERGINIFSPLSLSHPNGVFLLFDHCPWERTGASAGEAQFTVSSFSFSLLHLHT